MAAGRPSEYNYELCESICEEVANGKNVIAALKENDSFPSWSTFRRWKNDNEELQTLYIKAIQDKAEAVIFEIDSIAFDLRKGDLEPSVANVLIQTLKWKAAKFYPKMFGDNKQIDLNVDDKRLTPEERNKKIELLKSKLIDK